MLSLLHCSDARCFFCLESPFKKVSSFHAEGWICLFFYSNKLIIRMNPNWQSFCSRWTWEVMLESPVRRLFVHLPWSAKMRTFWVIHTSRYISSRTCSTWWCWRAPPKSNKYCKGHKSFESGGLPSVHDPDDRELRFWYCRISTVPFCCRIGIFGALESRLWRTVLSMVTQCKKKKWTSPPGSIWPAINTIQGSSSSAGTRCP